MLITPELRPQAPIGVPPAAMPEPVSTIAPYITIRSATPYEETASMVWRGIVGTGEEVLEVAEFSGGSMTHAPEVIAEYRRLAMGMPQDFLLIYLHRGGQAQCVNPLLPSLLHECGHRGPAHALRQSGAGGMTCDVVRFTRAMTQAGGAAMIIEDRQIRLAGAGHIRPALVHFHQFFKQGLSARQLLSEAAT